MVCFSETASSAAGVSVCHVSAEDVNLLYALRGIADKLTAKLHAHIPT